MNTYKLSSDLSSILKEIDALEDRRIDTELETINDLYDTRSIIHMIDDDYSYVSEAIL